MPPPTLDAQPILRYLSLPADHSPLPADDPIAFLARHLRELPPHLLLYFSSVTTPRERTVLPAVRNRRTKYALTDPPDLSFAVAKDRWPDLWQGGGGGTGSRARDEGKLEREWAEKEFLGGRKQFVGKLGNLLGDYEDERQAEAAHAARRAQRAREVFVPEEEDSDDDDDTAVGKANAHDTDEVETTAELQANFERVIRERFIYGLLEVCAYCLCTAIWN